MNSGTGQLRQSSALGGIIPEQPCDVTPSVSGLHEGLAEILNRLRQVNGGLDSTLQRIHGLRPVDAQEDKNPETPSVIQLATRVEQEISLLEKLTNDLCQFIG